jgi:hypothetical protein
MPTSYIAADRGISGAAIASRSSLQPLSGMNFVVEGYLGLDGVPEWPEVVTSVSVSIEVHRLLQMGRETTSLSMYSAPLS